MPDLILTLIGKDRPGIVETVADTVSFHGGNWLESRMAHLGGRFAGILRVEVPEERIHALARSLTELREDGLQVVVEPGGEPAGAPANLVEIELLGLDRPGLVRQVSDLLASRGVNVEELRTDRYSAPMSGELMFRAQLRVDVPRQMAAAELRGALERLAADLMVEIRLAEPAAAVR
jgi:glycine cleavage system regulatory protein